MAGRLDTPSSQAGHHRYPGSDQARPAFAVLAALGTLWYSLFFAMATDSCATQCNDAVLGSAYLVTWGGVATAAVAAVAGIVIAAKRGWVMWVWPTAASVMIVAALVIGVYLANSVIHHG